MARLELKVVVAAAWLAALGCGSRSVSKDGGADAGDDRTGAAGTGAAGTGAAGTGTAGTSAAGTGAAGAGAAGTGAGGSSTNCGGDLLGSWFGSDPNARPAVPPPPEDPCYKLNVSRNDDGTFNASSRWPAPQQRDAFLKFDDTHLAAAITDRGPVTIAYAASCLSKTTPRPTCAQLADGLLISGIGEGSVRSVECAAAGGGCNCTFAIVETGGPYGPYSVGNGLLMVTLFPETSFQKKVTTSYCVDGSTLRFGAAADSLAAGLSRITLHRVSCEDGKKDGAEEGIDCGGYCPDACP
jgi:hypothetical protein